MGPPTRNGASIGMAQVALAPGLEVYSDLVRRSVVLKAIKEANIKGGGAVVLPLAPDGVQFLGKYRRGHESHVVGDHALVAGGGVIAAATICI